MNILSFDIEEWYLEYLKCNRKEKYSEFDAFLNEILDSLDKNNIKATFFCVGEMGRLFPNVIKNIYSHGHEIGCHSNVHTWLNKMSQQEVFEDTRVAIDLLEQCIGEKVVSYRAPAFSIGSSNLWTFAIIKECGIERDASIFPAVRDYGGFSDFGSNQPCIIEHSGFRIKEFPICTTKLFNNEVAYSGGGYFRFFPLSYINRIMSNNPYNMLYFHIEDLLAETNGVMSRQEYEDYFKEKGTCLARYKRYIKSNLGKKGAFKKMMCLLESHRYVNINEADSLINWDNVTVIKL